MTNENIITIDTELDEQDRIVVDSAEQFLEDGLAFDLVLDGPRDIAKGVHVLDLHLRAELRLPALSDGDVCVAAQTSFFHVAIADIQIAYDLPN